MAFFRQSVLCFLTLTSCLRYFIGASQDVGSPLRVAQCRATCLQRFANDGPNGESMCLQGPDCFMCWENCELLQSNFQVWGAMCEEKEICFPGCQEACRFHAMAAARSHQTEPVIHTKGEGVIRVTGALARWPRPSSVDASTPLVYVVMRKAQNGPWRQIIQTLDHTTRVPVNSDRGDAMLRVLVVDPQGLVTIYSPDEAYVRENKKKKKTINTEIKATTSRTTPETAWILREISLIHQKVLVIGEIAWEPKANHGVYLVTWEVDGGGLKGNLFTDSTCVTLSLWPDTIYHIQVELVSRIPGVENIKSEMMDLDTGRAQKVSTDETDLNITDEDDTNSPLLSVLFSAVRGEKTKNRYHYLEIVLGGCTGVVLFCVVLVLIVYRSKRRRGMAMHNIITGSTSVRSKKLVEDFPFYKDLQPIVTVIGTPGVHQGAEIPKVSYEYPPVTSPTNQSEKTVQV
ncbi:uncharacterized protein LOC130893242 [Diorhabda carinulata]|uniref:uncharacterized protein LOC130893242 n=1 Tax=Diorhabda carinulata TaxID=1163345 RepID=UPI0025A224E3|nr:uncharacterized protein LOC130893242 [Diorhabda carinulata]